MPIPSQHEYEMREAQEFHRQLSAPDKNMLSERKEACQNFLEAMRDEPSLVAERVGWLIDGNYGYGSMKAAERVVKSPRMNRAAALTHMIAALEWQCPQRMAIAAWKKLTPAQKKALDEHVKAMISSPRYDEDK